MEKGILIIKQYPFSLRLYYIGTYLYIRVVHIVRYHILCTSVYVLVYISIYIYIYIIECVRVIKITYNIYCFTVESIIIVAIQTRDHAYNNIIFIVSFLYIAYLLLLVHDCRGALQKYYYVISDDTSASYSSGYGVHIYIYIYIYHVHEEVIYYTVLLDYVHDFSPAIYVYSAARVKNI